MSLPLCPCGSGVLYEECCYKKKGADGEPLFFKGCMSGDIDGSWHPIPNVRLAAIVSGESADKYRAYAKGLISKSKLNEKHHKDFINAYGLFFHSYEKLLEVLGESSGKGVSFRMDTIEARIQWKQYLINGRIFIDFIGLHSRGALGLNQKIGGLNRKKFDSLLGILKKQGEKDKRFLEIKTRLEILKDAVLDFIDLRNKEKSEDTIIEFPTVDYEYGIVDGGKVKMEEKTFKMIDFIKSSYESVRELAIILLDIFI